MRPEIERISKLYHTSWGEKIATVIGFSFLIALLLFLAFFAYRAMI